MEEDGPNEAASEAPPSQLTNMDTQNMPPPLNTDAAQNDNHMSFPHPPLPDAMEDAAAAAAVDTSTTATATAATPPRKREGPRKRCCVDGCTNHSKLHRVPPLPKPLPLGATKERQLTHAKRMLKRQEFMERLGRKRDDKAKDLRFCSDHQLAEQTVQANVIINDRDGHAIETVSLTLDLYLPVKKKKRTANGKNQRVIRKRCCVKDCTNHCPLKRVPPMPKPLELGASRDRQISRAKRLFKRTEYLKRLGYSSLDVEKHPDLRICPSHELETKIWTFTIPIVDGYGKETERIKATHEFSVPVQLATSDEATATGNAPPAVEQSRTVAATSSSSFGDPVVFSAEMSESYAQQPTLDDDDPDMKQQQASADDGQQQLAEYARAAAAAAATTSETMAQQSLETIPI